MLTFLANWPQWLGRRSRVPRLPHTNNPPTRSPYAVFISYRHVESDRSWAKWLQVALETYSIPEAIAREQKLGRRIGRVFRDEEELAASPDLSKDIRLALNDSDHLIVVCSPRTPSSKWVNAEVDHFCAIGRSDRILALLIEGEPAEAFPTSLCAIRTGLTDRNDLRSGDIETLEPLAADVRPLPGEGVRRRRRRALMRLLAPILGCRFDDLWQREQERQTRVFRNWALAASALTVVLVGLTYYAEINRQQAVIQRDHALQAQSYLLSELSKQQTVRGNGRLAILLALEALPIEMSAPNRPYVAAAESSLYQALVVPREIGVFRGHTDIVRQVAFSPDGGQVITASYDHSARLWNPATFEPLVALRGHQDIIMHVQYSRDGKHVVTASADRTARLWRTDNGTQVRVLRGHTDKVCQAVFSPDGKRVATASHDGTARIWDVASGKELAVLRGHTNKLMSIDFSPNGDHIVTASEDGSARLWYATTGKPFVVLRGHGKKVNTATFSLRGTEVVTASDDSTARIWTVLNGRSIVLRGHTKAVLRAVFSPDGTSVATASEDGTARLWRATDGVGIAVLNTGESIVNHVAFRPDGGQIVTSSGVLDLGRSTARLWNVSTGVEEGVLDGHEGMLFAATFSANGERIVTASYDNTARLWTREGSLRVHGTEDSCAIDTTSNASSVQSSMAKPPSPTDAKSSNTQRKTNGNATDFRGFLENLDWLDEVRTEDGHIRRAIGILRDNPPVLVNLDSPAITELKGHKGSVHSAAFSPDGSRIVTASSDHTARLWNGVNGGPIVVLSGHDDTVWHAAFNSNGSHVVTASQDQTARVWAVDGTALLILKGHDGAVIHVGFSPDGNKIVTSSWDGTARIWDGSTGAALHILRGHSDKVTHALFSPDEKRVATASLDGTARLWDVNTGQEIGVLPGPARDVLNVNFEKNGDVLTISGAQGTMSCYRIFRDTKALVAFAESMQLEKFSLKERNRYGIQQR